MSEDLGTIEDLVQYQIDKQARENQRNKIITQLKAEIQKLKAENERLRHERDTH